MRSSCLPLQENDDVKFVRRRQNSYEWSHCLQTLTKNDTDRKTDSETVGYTCCMSRLHPGTEVTCENSGTPDENFNNLVKINQEPRKWVIDTVKD
ncbi:hypothetical protein DPMN_029293 [Dreissena polymorpha]|uniref:Uncharacterized protein n=1 Tax=Dreissena polymorpha TaxID=45954 RepID=A0A9D4RFC2_DREPO|nr:hypothetical protein DPMN_029293 [Dreissena polymorpha]